MTYWLVVWTTFKCPFWMPASIPAEVKPIFCRQIDHAEEFGPRALAIERAQSVGPDARPKIFKTKDEKYEPVTLEWKHQLEIKEG